MPASGEWHISSLVVHARAARAAAVGDAITALAQAEVRAGDGNGKLVVLLETENEAQILDSLRRIESIDGVLSAALVYHQVDSGEIDAEIDTGIDAGAAAPGTGGSAVPVPSTPTESTPKRSGS